MPPREGPGWIERAAVFVVVVLAVVLVAVVAAPALSPHERVDDGPDVDTPPEAFAVDAVEPTRLRDNGSVSLPAEFTVDGGAENKTVLIEPGRAATDDVRQLTVALTLAGHEVLFAGPNLEGALGRADAFVVLDPSGAFGSDELNATREFVDSGGRIVMMSEPNRKEISANLFSVSVSTVRSQMRPLAAEFDVVFGRRYLYDTERKDGNFKNVLGEGRGTFDGTVALYTATNVRVRNGTAVLETPPSTHLSTNGSAGPYTVAATAAGGDVLAIGDSTFVQEGRHNVADNEAFLGYVLEFALQGDLNESAYNPNPEGGFGTGEPIQLPDNVTTVTPVPGADATAAPAADEDEETTATADD